MEYDRAKEIISNQALVQVTYHGIPVYIQSLESNSTATVFPLDNMDELQTVDIQGLTE